MSYAIFPLVCGVPTTSKTDEERKVTSTCLEAPRSPWRPGPAHHPSSRHVKEPGIAPAAQGVDSPVIPDSSTRASYLTRLESQVARPAAHACTHAVLRARCGGAPSLLTLEPRTASSTAMCEGHPERLVPRKGHGRPRAPGSGAGRAAGAGPGGRGAGDGRAARGSARAPRAPRASPRAASRLGPTAGAGGGARSQAAGGPRKGRGEWKPRAGRPARGGRERGEAGQGRSGPTGRERPGGRGWRKDTCLRVCGRPPTLGRAPRPCSRGCGAGSAPRGNTPPAGAAPAETKGQSPARHWADLEGKQRRAPSLRPRSRPWARRRAAVAARTPTLRVSGGHRRGQADGARRGGGPSSPESPPTSASRTPTAGARTRTQTASTLPPALPPPFPDRRIKGSELYEYLFLSTKSRDGVIKRRSPPSGSTQTPHTLPCTYRSEGINNKDCLLPKEVFREGGGVGVDSDACH